MYLRSLATAVPPLSLTQREGWEVAQNSPAVKRLSRRSAMLLEAVLKGDSGVAKRHFAGRDIDRVFDLNADELNVRFRMEAPRLAGEALASALAKAGLAASDLDALVVCTCTCTGYLCPGVSSYVAEAMGLRADAFLQDLVGLGCGAAIPALRAVQGILAADPEARVACVAVEVCSAAFFLDDDPGVLISACLFGDGAAATIWSGQPAEGALRCHGFETLHVPADRDKLRFEQRDGKLRNLLDRAVPGLAADAVTRLSASDAARRAEREVDQVIAHPGGRDVIAALERALPGRCFAAGRRVLSEFGNMSSPSVLFVLEEAWRAGAPGAGRDWWLVSFGAGFSAHSCRLGG